MAEKTTANDTDEEIPPTFSSIPAEDPPTTTDNGVVSEKPTDSQNDSDTTVELHDEQPNRKKRRKNCPEYLVDAVKQTHSFTFDTVFCATPDSTPKFGSFDSGTIRCDRAAGKSEVGDARSESEVVEVEEEGEKSEVSGGEVIVGLVDGVVGSGVD